jgi:hypothetical protein
MQLILILYPPHNLVPVADAPLLSLRLQLQEQVPAHKLQRRGVEKAGAGNSRDDVSRQVRRPGLRLLLPLSSLRAAVTCMLEMLTVLQAPRQVA